MSTADFLFELGCEELPAIGLHSLATCFADEIGKGLTDHSLSHSEIDLFVTPRRLAVLIHDVQLQQADQLIERRGPALQAAFDKDGNPSRAALGFATSCGTDLEHIERLETDKGSWLFFKQTQAGKQAKDIIPDIINQAIKRLPIPRPMYWGNEKQRKFARPVHWLVMMLGKEIIQTTLLELPAGNITYGHRFHSPKAIKIARAADYIKKVCDNVFVVPAFSDRKQRILDLATTVANQHGGKLIADEALLDEVTGLVEWPVALQVPFDEQFLQVPREVLITSMRNHQKCFAIEDEHGQLLPYFITISNISSKNESAVVKGNNRVMRARLADADFFYRQDLKTLICDFQERLTHIQFQQGLGTLSDKSKRIAAIASQLAEQLALPSAECERAGLLCKTDLASDMVGEFPELQGIMGYYYAKQSGENEAIATAIKESYQPRFAADELPKSDIGGMVAIADRMDSLVGIFSLGKLPTGDKDPFALRRAAYGVIRIITEKEYRIDLQALIANVMHLYGSIVETDGLLANLLSFFRDRLKAWYVEQGFPTQIVQAVLEKQHTKPLDFKQRILAVKSFSALPEAEALAAANKRVNNILTKQAKGLNTLSINQSLLTDSAEKQLVDALTNAEASTTPLYETRDYQQILGLLSQLRLPIDQFFDGVMVMADDQALRQNRLAILQKIQHLFGQIADISVL